MLSSQEASRLQKGQPVSLIATASAWAERHIFMGLASFLQVRIREDEMFGELQQAVRCRKLSLYHATLKRERLYELADEPKVMSGSALLLPSSVDSWLASEEWMPSLIPPDIRIPEVWKEQVPQGIQRFDDTDGGRLVRVADLAQWLMGTGEMRRHDAIMRLCSTLDQYGNEDAGWLYLLSENRYALRLGEDFSFVPVSPMPENYGLAGAINHMHTHWGESAEPGARNSGELHILDCLAIRIDVAHMLWGYGRVVPEQTVAATSAEMEPAPETSKGTPSKLSAADKEKIKHLYDRGRGQSVNSMSRQFGVSRPVIDKVLKRAGVKT